MKVEIESNYFLFISAYLLCMIDAILLGYSSFGSIPGTGILSKILRIGALGLVTVKVFGDGFYSLQDIILMFAVSAILFVAYLKSGYNHIFYFLIVFLGMKGIKAEKIVKIDFAVKAFLSFIVIICSVSGMIEHYVTYRTGEKILRYSLGFSHPNTLASIVFSLIIEEIYISHRKVNGFYVLTIWLIDIILYMITANRTVVFLLGMFPLLLLNGNERGKNKQNNKKSVSAVCCYPSALLFSFLAMKYTGKIKVFTRIDGWFSNRFYNARVLYDRYGIAVLGQKVKLISVKTARLLHSSVALLDIAYLRMLIQAGPVVLAIFGYMYCKSCSRAAEKNDKFLLHILFMFILYGFCESGFNNVFINFTVLLMVEVFYGNEWKEKEYAA